jgi:hypothetical protein
VLSINAPIASAIKDSIFIDLHQPGHIRSYL